MIYNSSSANDHSYYSTQDLAEIADVDFAPKWVLTALDNCGLRCGCENDEDCLVWSNCVLIYGCQINVVQN